MIVYKTRYSLFNNTKINLKRTAIGVVVLTLAISLTSVLSKPDRLNAKSAPEISMTRKTESKSETAVDALGLYESAKTRTKPLESIPSCRFTNSKFNGAFSFSCSTSMDTTATYEIFSDSTHLKNLAMQFNLKPYKDSSKIVFRAGKYENLNRIISIFFDQKMLVDIKSSIEENELLAWLEFQKSINSEADDGEIFAEDQAK